jgi:hypothetical protein
MGLISNCGRDERGAYRGGRPGDQDSGEWVIRPWNNRPWNSVIRYTGSNSDVRNLIARLAIEAAKNDQIGYDQADRLTFWQELQKVNYCPANITTPCEADCSSGVLSIVKAVGFILNIAQFQSVDINGYTGNMEGILVNAGFSALTNREYLISDNLLQPGDILLNYVHHTTIYVGTQQDVDNLLSNNMLPSTYISSIPDIDASEFTPFIATVDPVVTSINYSKIKEARISGMMFLAGELYDASYNRRSMYMQSNLDTQIGECLKADLPYALYANVRARSYTEADAECRALYYVLANHPPKLGIWLSIQNKCSKAENNTIIDLYYNYLVKWGFKDKCGLYINKDTLSRIDWAKYQDKFYLWLIDDNIDISKIDDELLEPELFEVQD